ncbi:MAG TPA: copper resistance CopC family protein [Gemmatimonadales bacterium]|nr:copper resistance CopC family protein [Gemmatimonadales bacterium]
MQTIVRRLVGGALVGSLMLPPMLSFHAHLTHSLPAADSTVATAPSAIKLWFSESPERAVSRIELMSADSTRTTLKLAPATADTLLIAGQVAGALKPGTYTVIWRTSSDDGHPVRGRFKFTYAPGSSAGAKR